jgi:G3E family GTPase
MTDQRIPVTVLTGFLGAGKTTLLNYLLTAQHGRRIAVVENEFGEVGIDHHLVLQADEEIFEMNNGCICCTVRGDLIRILGQLAKRRERFEQVVIETTGLADPAPVAQTFFVDADIQAQYRLDGIVTVVDARHLPLHLDSSDEAQQQVAFADVILLNKTDLVEPPLLDQLEQRLRSVNGLARLHRTHRAHIDPQHILDIGGFDLARALRERPTFLEPEMPFEWIGVYDLPAGEVTLHLDPGPDPGMDFAVLPASGHDPLPVVSDAAVRAFSEEDIPVVEDGGVIKVPLQGTMVDLHLGEDGADLQLELPVAGAWALVTQHLPEEFALRVLDGDLTLQPRLARTFNPNHEHEESVGSVGIEVEGEVDPKAFESFLMPLLQERGQDIYRSKGILNIAGSERRYVFQGVHMLMDGNYDRAWEPRERRLNQVVFIGRNLDRAALTSGFRACVRPGAALAGTY